MNLSLHPLLEMWAEGGLSRAAGADVPCFSVKGWRAGGGKRERKRGLDPHLMDSLHRETPWALGRRWPGPLTS